MGKAKRVSRRQRVSRALRAQAVQEDGVVSGGDRDEERGRVQHAAAANAATTSDDEEDDGMLMQWSDDDDGDDEKEGATRRKRTPMKSAERRLRRRDTFVSRLMAERERALASVKEGGVRKRCKTPRRRRATARGDGKTLQSLDQLKDALPEMAERKQKVIDPHATTTRTGMRSGRALSKISIQEMHRLDRVRSHPSFMENPLAAITAHLHQTLPKEPPRKAPEKTNRSKRRRQKATKDARMAVD